MNSKLQTQFKSMEVRNSSFSAFIDLLTPNTYVMVIISDPDVCKYIQIHIGRVYLMCNNTVSYYCIAQNIGNYFSCLDYLEKTSVNGLQIKYKYRSSTFSWPK